MANSSFKLTKVDDLFSVKNKIVIITGAGRGIGRKFAIKMAERSALFSKVVKKEKEEEQKLRTIKLNKFHSKD